MLFPLPRKVFTLPLRLFPPMVFGAEEWRAAALALITPRYPGAILQAVEYAITEDAYLVSVLHQSFPLVASGHGVSAEPWEPVDYQEPIPCCAEED